MFMQKHLTGLLSVIFVLVGCQKETSIESGRMGPLVGEACRLKQIVSVDSVTGRGSFSFLTGFDASGLARSVELIDSISGIVQFDAPLIWSGDTLRLSDSVYYVTDANRRLKEFVALQMDNGTLMTLKYLYTYDVSGFMVKKELYSSAVPLPIPLIRFTYTWAGLNLVSIDGSVVIPGLTQKLFSASLEYDPAASAKNFLLVLPDAAELTPVIMAVGLGNASRNLVRRIDVNTFDDTGAIESTATSRYTAYGYSADGYLLEWKVSGDVPEALPFPTGKNVFRYHCR
jgi:hypothetical protein